MDGLNDVFLKIDYSGDTAEAYLNRGWFRKEESVISDNFYNGMPWETGLKRFMPEVMGNAVELRISPLYEGAAVYLEKQPSFNNGAAAEIHKVELIPEYKAVVTKQ